jgi:2-oxoglutarate ferredoxin oxidoreductase subunit alpha
MHLRWLNPLPPEVEQILARYDRVLVPEMNLGQLVHVLRDKFLIDAVSISRVQGQPFKAQELSDRIRSTLDGE